MRQPGACLWLADRRPEFTADDLKLLAGLVQIKNKADAAIAELIGRPSAPGNIGEFAAAAVFAIQLVPSGSHPGYDGMFTAGHLAGKTVNIKTYSRHESILDISRHLCDYYLALTGPAWHCPKVSGFL